MTHPFDDTVPSSGPTTTVPGAGLGRGTTVGRYVILSELGSGAMGVVYAAYDPDLDRKVALKFLRTDASDPEARARLVREAQALAQLSHPNVVAVHDVGAFDERVWLAMEFVEGQSLGAWCRQRSPGWKAIVDLLVHAGRGLAAAHAAGLVHRDFKPDNVMIGTDGRARVMDLGLARRGDVSRGMPRGQPISSDQAATDVQPDLSKLALRVTQAGAVLGTPAYMAPEQFTGAELAPSVDIFAFSVTLWEALYGERPFAGETILELVAHVIARRRPPKAAAAPPAQAKRCRLRVRSWVSSPSIASIVRKRC